MPVKEAAGLCLVAASVSPARQLVHFELEAQSHLAAEALRLTGFEPEPRKVQVSVFKRTLLSFQRPSLLPDGVKKPPTRTEGPK
jgi:hypothetical protein